MGKYSLLRIKNRKSKEGKEYFIAYVLLDMDYDCQLLNILLQPKQVEPLMNCLKDNTFNLDKYVSVEYNSFLKAYKPVITYGL